MKRTNFILLVALAGMLVFSCASNEAATQEQVNEAFETVYETYESLLLLDGAKGYKVKSGDTLSSIAKEFYGNENGYYFPVIMLASSETILDPDLIAVGMELTIPDLERNLADPVSRGNMKKYFKDIADVYKKKDSEVAATIRTELLAISKGL